MSSLPDAVRVRCMYCGCYSWVKNVAYTYCAYCYKPKFSVTSKGEA